MKILLKWLTITHQFWLATSAVGGACIALFYWWLFGINPFHDGNDAKERVDLVTYYCDVALRHIDKGNYDQASSEYTHAIALSANHVRASVGLALCGLVIDERKVDWTPTVGTAVVSALGNGGLKSLDEFAHVILKYKGDVAARLGRDSLAVACYNTALAVRPTYNDALYALGWMEYFGDSCRIDVMRRAFSKMLANDSTDSRAYNGIAYSYFMSAVMSDDIYTVVRNLETADSLYNEALAITSSADFNVLYGAAEVAMLLNPYTSIRYFAEGIRCITDSTLNNLYVNSENSAARLFVNNQSSATRLWILSNDSGGTIHLRTPQAKMATMFYGMSVNAVVLAHLDEKKKAEYWLQLGDDWLAAALRLDPARQMLHIFDGYTYICTHVYSMRNPQWAQVFVAHRKKARTFHSRMSKIPIEVLQEIGAVTGS